MEYLFHKIIGYDKPLQIGYRAPGVEDHNSEGKMIERQRKSIQALFSSIRIMVNRVYSINRVNSISRVNPIKCVYYIAANELPNFEDIETQSGS